MNTAAERTLGSKEQTALTELEKLALVASRTHNIVIVTDAEARTEWVNAAFTRVTGYTLEDVKGRRVGPLVQGELTDPLTVRHMREAIRAGRGFQVEIQNYAKDGHTYWLEVDSRPFHSPDGKVLGFVGVETDVTVRKAMEEELRRRAVELRAFVEALPDSVFRVDRDGQFIDAHVPDPDSFVAPKDAVIGRHISELLPVDVAVKLVESIANVLDCGKGCNIEFQVERMTGVRDFEARIVPASIEQVLVIVRNVSERKLLERLKDELISTVSHELRTPLTAIRGTLGLLGGGVLGAISPEAQELVNMSLSNAERLSRLIDDILDLERVMQGGLELDLEARPLLPLIERCIHEAEPFAAEFGTCYVLESDEADARARIDGDRFMQVLNNLLSNAAKYGDPNDTVKVTLKSSAQDWRISVQNHGRPIPVDFRPRLFRPVRPTARHGRRRGIY